MVIMEIWVIIGILLALFWIHQFVCFMELADRAFPGRHDKVLWFVAFLLLPILAPFAFYYWKQVPMGGSLGKKPNEQKPDR